MLVFDAETLAKQLALLFFDKTELRGAARAAAHGAASASQSSRMGPAGLSRSSQARRGFLRKRW